MIFHILYFFKFTSKYKHMKAKELHIDGIDKIILKHLMNDARTPILAIAREIGISGAAVHQRLRKLEASGLIAGSKFVRQSRIFLHKSRTKQRAIAAARRFRRMDDRSRF